MLSNWQFWRWNFSGVYLEEQDSTEKGDEEGEGEENENFMNLLDNLGGDQVFQE